MLLHSLFICSQMDIVKYYLHIARLKPHIILNTYNVSYKFKKVNNRLLQSTRKRKTLNAK